MTLLRAAGILLFASLTAGSLSAQGNLRSRLENGLFHFGDCDQPLCLNSSISAQGGHGEHYIGSKQTGTQTLLDFLSGAIATGISDVPISTATSGITFNVVGGVPEPTSTSAGPIFADRVQTLGRGRVHLGVNVTGVQFSSVRGVPLNNIALVFTHQNICRATGEPPLTGAACPGTGPLPLDSALGSPTFENDVIEVNTSIDLKLQVAALSVTYGLTNRIDIGASLPLVRADLTGGSIARITPFATPTPHFFGDATNPQFAAGSSTSGTATGIGDVAARLKVNLGRPDRGVALLTEARFPTGDEKQFLGSGEFALTVLGIASARLGNFSPHLNAGYLYRNGTSLTDAVITKAGFDHLMTSWATIAVDVLGQWQATKNPLVLPDPVTFTLPNRRTIQPTNIPKRVDNIVDGSVGFKFLTRSGVTLVTNAVVPLNRGGMRANIIWTAGAEYNF